VKKIIGSLVLLVIAVFAGCNDGSQKRLGMEKIVTVEPQHATRVIVVYKDKNGLYYEISLHHAFTEDDGYVKIDPREYLDGKKPYGPLPGREKEYQEYLTGRCTR
jgi:hypothetical protein